MKKTSIYLILILLLPLAQLFGQSSLTVKVTGLENNKGKVIVALLDENEQDVDDIHTPIKDNECSVTFKNVKHGKYAVRFIHDENENEELDMNFIGIPKEGFGFSNDAMGRFGPKDFSEWLFPVAGDTEIVITASYLF